jgi:hypothetical protein
MFRIIICIVLLYLPIASFAQSKAIEDFYNHYQGQKDISRVELQGGILNLVASFTDESDADELIRKVTRLRVLNMDEGNLVSKSDLGRLVKAVKRDRFEDLMQIRDEGDDIQILIREQKGAITDILVLIYGDENFTMLSLEGKMRFKDIQNLNIEFEGGEHLEKVAKERANESPDRA